MFLNYPAIILISWDFYNSISNFITSQITSYLCCFLNDSFWTVSSYIYHWSIPKISKFFFNIFQACFKSCEIPIQWWSAQKIYIPKVSSLSENKLSDFHPIALLNIEGKLFFSLISKCLETYMIHDNKFINNSIPKGCMEKISGCWERLSIVWHALKETRSQKV